jgi:hypothetical protein
MKNILSMSLLMTMFASQTEFSGKAVKLELLQPSDRKVRWIQIRGRNYNRD